MNSIALKDATGLVARAQLDCEKRDAMFSLLSMHFEGVTRAQFDRDLDEKNWVIEIHRHGQLCGFSTLLVRDAEVDGEVTTVVYSGDTIVAPEAWNSPALARSWISGVNQLRASAPHQRCYWLLLSSGFRTYRLLPVFWREFFPRYDAVASFRDQRLLSKLAQDQYGRLFDASTGIVRFPRPQVLRPALREVPAGRKVDPHIGFFLACNPEYQRGDELVCIAEISDRNLTPAGRRMIR